MLEYDHVAGPALRTNTQRMPRPTPQTRHHRLKLRRCVRVLTTDDATHSHVLDETPPHGETPHAFEEPKGDEAVQLAFGELRNLACTKTHDILQRPTLHLVLIKSLEEVPFGWAQDAPRFDEACNISQASPPRCSSLRDRG